MYKYPICTLWVVLFSISAAQGKIFKNNYYNNSYALVIGIDTYPASKWQNLDSAVEGAKAVKGLLENHGFVVETLYNEKAGQQEIIKKIDGIALKLGAQDRFIIYFAGHGEKDADSKGYLVPYNGTDYQSYIPLKQLAAYSKSTLAKHFLLILDACYAGFIKTRGPSLFKMEDPKYLDTITRKKARHAITAGGKNQEVLDSGGPGGHSPFTGHLLEGIKKGRADGNGDGYITNYEMFGYLGPNAATEVSEPNQIRLLGDDDGMFVFISEIGATQTFQKVKIGGKARSKLKKNIDNPVYLNEKRERYERLSAADWMDKANKAKSSKEAIEFYTQAIQLYPEFAQAFYNRALAWEGIAKPRSDALNSTDKNSKETNSIGYEQAIKKALEDYQKGLEILPQDVDAQLNIGTIYFEEKNYSLALAAFNKALKINPRDPGAYTRRAEVYLELKQVDKAFADYNYAIKLDPEDPYLFYDRGNGFVTLGKHKEGINNFTKAIELLPEEDLFYQQRGEAYEKVGAFGKAIQDFETADNLTSTQDEDAEDTEADHGLEEGQLDETNEPGEMEDLEDLEFLDEEPEDLEFLDEEPEDLEFLDEPSE